MGLQDLLAEKRSSKIATHPPEMRAHGMEMRAMMACDGSAWHGEEGARHGEESNVGMEMRAHGMERRVHDMEMRATMACR